MKLKEFTFIINIDAYGFFVLSDGILKINKTFSDPEISN
jgi:hypothetical protein